MAASESTSLVSFPTNGSPDVADLPVALSPAEADFAVYLADGNSPVDAYRMAFHRYGKDVDRVAVARLMLHPMVKERVAMLAAICGEYIGLTKAAHATKLEELRNKAIYFAEANEKQQGSLMRVALDAETARGELAGLYVGTAGKSGSSKSAPTGVKIDINFVKPASQEPLTVEGEVV